MRKNFDFLFLTTLRQVLFAVRARNLNLAKGKKFLEYTCLGILLATFNYRARRKFGLSTLNYSLNEAANAW